MRIIHRCFVVACTYTRQHSRARIPGTCAAALNRAHTEIADFASDFFCAEGEVATSSCVPSYCPDATSSCVPVSEEVQGPLCGMTCAGVDINAALPGFDYDEIPDGTEVTITLAIAQQAPPPVGTPFPTMTDEMCTAACAIAEAAYCMNVRSRARALTDGRINHTCA